MVVRKTRLWYAQVSDNVNNAKVKLGDDPKS